MKTRVIRVDDEMLSTIKALAQRYKIPNATPSKVLREFMRRKGKAK